MTADMKWKTVPVEGWHLQYTPPPSEWHYSHNMSAILCPSAKGDERIILDMRGWGYLTGKGHGALGLDSETAAREQDALALFIIDACKLAASPPAPGAEPVALPPIEVDPHMPSREYIPLPGGWEIQTKGSGSSYRICDTKTGERRNFTETYLHDFLTRMAKEVHAACSPIDPAAIRAEALAAEVDYVLQHGGRCRECADRDGVCETGLPCGVEDAKKVIRHVIRALNYGRSHGFIAALADKEPGR